ERPGRRQPPRLAGCDEARPLQGRARGPRLCHARGREVRGRAGARSPSDAAARAVGAARPRRGHRRGTARDRADAARRRRRAARGVVTRTAAPKLGAYAALTAFGLLAALVLGQPPVVALPVPFALVLGLG